MTSSLSMVCSATETESGWGTATLIETNDTGSVQEPQVAADGSGNAIAVWCQSDGTRTSVWANRYVVGWGWGTATLIETDNVEDAYNAEVAVDGSGNAIVVWHQWDGTRTNVWANRYVVGWGWGMATLIESDNAGDAYDADVAIDGSGNAIAVWVQWDGTYNSICSNRYVVGIGWGAATLIEDDSMGDASQPRVTIDDSGNAMVVWCQSDGIRRNIWANRYVVDLGWGTAALIETDNAGDATRARVAVDGSGNAIVVWHQWDGTHDDVWANRYVVDSGWGTAALIETDDAGDATIPDVAVDRSGNATAVWRQSDGIRENIWANRYVVDSGWGTAALIETDNAGDATRARVAVDNTGNAVAVWWQSDGIRENIWANRYVVDSGWGIATLIETDDAGDAEYPEVTVDDSGNAIAVWEQWDGTRRNILSNRYVEPDITPPPLSLVSPADGLTTETSAVTVSGTTESGVSLVVNGISVAVEPDGAFSCEIALLEGENTITATATDASDNYVTVSVSVTYINPVDELEDELEDTKDELVDVRDELNTTQDELDAIEEELDATKDELDVTKDELNTTQSDLDAVEDELSATQDDLNAAEEELTSTSDDLESVKSQNLALMAVLAIVAILAVVMSMMFMSLRKKIAGMEVKAADEEPPPPQS